VRILSGQVRELWGENGVKMGTRARAAGGVAGEWCVRKRAAGRELWAGLFILKRWAGNCVVK